MTLRPIIDTCVPRKDILEGRLTDAHFAAQLDAVVREPEKYPVYGDPTAFFAVTYPTAGLKRLLASTFGRLSGKKGEVDGAEHGVVRFQTSFGGGKTHGLIAAYHLAKGARPLAIGEFIDPDLLPDTCQVAAVVGDTIDPSTGIEVNGRRVRTMWGAIAAQLGDEAWAKVEQQDHNRTAPGTETWVEIFEAAPTLVIIDEVAAHMRALGSSGDPDIRRQADAMPSFLFSLFTAAARVGHARVIITLATEHDAFAAETAAVSKLLDTDTTAGAETESVLARFREVLVPAEEHEISAILRRRLFESIDESAAAEAAEAFADYYADLEKKEINLNFWPDVKHRISLSYPFHPELIRVLDSRVGTIPSFQRTRGALRLLAEAVADLWSKRTDAVIINVADLPLDADAVANALTRAIDRETFAQVIEADVAGPGSHAADVDKARFTGTTPYTTRAATTVFVHSLEQTPSRGATSVDVLRGTVAPGHEPDFVEEALAQLDLSAWHLDYDGVRWRFDTEPNPRKIVEDEKQAVPNSRVREELEHRIERMFAPFGPVKTRVFPVGPEEVEDRPELRLVVMHFDAVAVTSRDASPPPSALVDMLDTYGVGRANRTYRNSLVFLVADRDHIEAMREAVRWDVAAQRVVGDPQRLSQFAEAVRKKLKDIADRAGLDARVAITRCYRHLYYPKADRANKHLRHHELSHTKQGDQEPKQTQVIQQTLESLGKIRTTPIATDFLARVAEFPKKDPVPTIDAVEGFWRDHDADIVLDPNLVIQAITAGIRNGEWVYYDSDAQRAYDGTAPAPAVRVAPTTYLYTRTRAEEAGLLRRDPTWADVERELIRTGGVIDGTSLRNALENQLGYEPTKTAITGILERVMKREPAPVVVVEGEPAPESSVLSPSAVVRTPLERMTVLTREKAESLGISVVDRRTGFTLREEGAPGPTFGSLSDKLAELGAGKKITRVTIAKTVSDAGVSELRTLLRAGPMLPKLDFTVELNGAAAFPGLSGSVGISMLAGPESDFRKFEKDIFGLLDRADSYTVELTMSCAPEGGLEIGSDAWSRIASTFTELASGVLRVEVQGE